MATRVCSASVVTGVLLSGLLLAACGADPPGGADPGAYQTRPAAYQVGSLEQPAGPQWLVRLADGEDPLEHQIRQLAVAGDHLYFTAGWEAVYRVARSGGDIEVVDSGPGALFEHIAAQGDEVAWLHTTFDDRDYPTIRLRRGGSGPARTVFEGALATLSTNMSVQFQASAGAVVLNAAPSGSGNSSALLRVSLNGGVAASLLPIADVFQSPVWTIDDRHLYLTPPTGPGPSPVAKLQRMALAGGAAEDWVPLPAPGAQVRAVDATDVYLTTSDGIWRVSKQTGEVTRIFTSTTGTLDPRALQVDATDVYFVQRDRGVERIHAVIRDGGAARMVAELSTGPMSYLVQLAQDAENLYVLRGWSEIAVVSKHPAGTQ